MKPAFLISKTDPDGGLIQVQVFPDVEALSHAAARALIETMETVLAGQDRFSLALAGGSTPRRLYELLAGPYRQRIAWNKLYLFWGDERYVPHDDPASNYGAAHEALLRHVDLPPGHVFPIPTHLTPAAAAAAAYAATLRAFFGDRPPAFDLTLLGLGADGHTASLFPGDTPPGAPAPEAAPWVEAVEAPPRYAPRTRITLALPLLNQSHHVFFLVAGEDKQAPLRGILYEADRTLPGMLVRAQEQVTWFVDEAAFGRRKQE